MNEQNIKLCEICGRATSITNIVPQANPYAITPMTYFGNLGTPIKFCPGHPAPEHNGQLDPEGKYRVFLNEADNTIVVEDGDYSDPAHEYTELTPKRALSLLAWLQQKQELLKKLAEDTRQ